MTTVIAHRGASRAFPENTVEAFEAAVEMGADAVELDVRRSADGHLVVCHDGTFADGRRVHETPWSERPPAICDLDAALDACGQLVVNVEVKNLRGDPGYDAGAVIADQVAALLLERGTPQRYLVSSFDLATVDRVRATAPGLATAFLFVTGIEPLEAIRIAAAGGHRAVHPHDRAVDEAFMDRARAAGLEVNVWTVDAPTRIRELAALGVDGIVTNVPDVARAALRS